MAMSKTTHNNDTVLNTMFQLEHNTRLVIQG